MKPEIANAVLRVGGGRGFVVEHKKHRLVITAAHCLPHFPVCQAASYIDDRVYDDLLGPIGDKTTVWAECLFADPISDLAILGQPDNQILVRQAEAYDALTGGLAPLMFGNIPQKGKAWLLALDGEWFECVVTHRNGPIYLTGARRDIEAGMSGSPIVGENGRAVGVVCISGGADSATEGGPNPRLPYSLPVWMLL